MIGGGSRAGAAGLAGSLLLPLLAGCASLPAPAASSDRAPYWAWARFDAAGIDRSGASGWADRARARPLAIDDPVRIASISKLVVALGALRLVEQGRLDLDIDVSAWLGWPLRNPHHPDRPITLRALLSHTSSLRDDVDYAIPYGVTLRERLAAPAAFDRDHPPGAYFRYSNLNFPVVAAVMEKAGGERFDRLMDDLVLRPLGLQACFNWTTCSDERLEQAVVLTDPEGAIIRDDLAGRRPDCPVLLSDGQDCDLSDYPLGSNGAIFSPQGGLRISVRDLAAIGALLLNDGRHADRPFLSPASMEMLRTPLWRFDGANGDIEGGFYCAYGLAMQFLPIDQAGCRDDLFGDGRAVAGHAGDAYGLRSGLWIDRASGQGIAYFATANGDDPPRGRSAYRAIEEALAARIDQAGRGQE